MSPETVRYVVRASGRRAKHSGALDQLAGHPNYRILERLDERLALVELQEGDVDELKRLLPGWAVVPENTIELFSSWPRYIYDVRARSAAPELVGATAMRFEPTNIAMLVAGIVAAASEQAQAGGVELRSDVAPDLPLLDLDQAGIRQALQNVVENAVRYTQAGGTVELSVEPDLARKTISIWVRDTGAGIDADALPHVFDAYYKSRESRGAGIGLTIAKDVVEAHGGEIVAESAGREQGTAVRIGLPISV